ncbi:MAG: hypothetical protein ACI9CA_000555, partial [Natronomonas sp.]
PSHVTVILPVAGPFSGGVSLPGQAEPNGF